MARKRMIHPDIWTDEKFLSLPNDESRLLFIGMMNFADDEGIFKHCSITIKCQVMPLSATNLELIEDYLSSMLKFKLLEKGIDIDETKLLRYKNWHTYQKINHATPTKYTFTLITEKKKGNSVNPNGGLSEDSIRTNSQYSIDKISLDKYNISSKKNQDFTFERFYDLYPKKQAKEKARNTFKRLKKGDLKALEVGLDSWLRYWKESSIDAQFIPLPATWINQKRWEDDIPSVDDKDPEFKSDLDKELFNRNKNIIEQSKRMRDYLKEANDKADEVPDLLADYKENKKSNAKSIKEVIGQMDTLIKSDSSTDAK